MRDTTADMSRLSVLRWFVLVLFRFVARFHAHEHIPTYYDAHVGYLNSCTGYSPKTELLLYCYYYYSCTVAIFPKNLLWCWLAIWCLYDASILLLLLLLHFYLLLCHWILATTLNWILPHAAGALLSTLFYLLWLLLAAVVHFSLTVHFCSSVGLCSF